jgi:hypothetical protein
MSELLQFIAIVSLWSWGFYNAFQEGQILGRIGEWLRDEIVDTWLKPIIGCPVCMPSIHGTVLYLVIGESFNIVTLFVIIVCASGLNFVIKEHLYPD